MDREEAARGDHSATVAQAQTVRTTTQLRALQDLQALQVAQQQAQAILRAAGGG